MTWMVARDPAQRSRNATLAIYARHYGRDDPRTIALRAEVLEEAIARLVADAPPLSADQVQRLRDLLPPVGGAAGGS